MTPISFCVQGSLNPASGFQSMQSEIVCLGSETRELAERFREDDSHSLVCKRFEAPSLGDTFYAALRSGSGRTGYDTAVMRSAGSVTENVPRLSGDLTHLRSETKSFNLPSCWSTNEYFLLWRSHHIKMVERMVGTKRGTGGSEGVRLTCRLPRQEVFPELWEARNTSIQNTRGWLSLCRCGNHTERSSVAGAGKESAPPNLVTKSKRVPTNERRRAPRPK